ncbi:MAG: hypothetical protein D3918_11805 [Candidatus Electrothrix sp. AX2]|nr:hypothetical protein [Candidatus Electrothrix gigas]
MNNSVTIGHTPSIKPKTFFIFFISVFTTLWTFIQPLELFGILSQEITSIGFWGYLLLLIAAFFLSLIPTKIYKNWLFEKQEFLHIIFESSSDGIDHLIKTPKNIQVMDFTNLLLDYLAKGNAKKRVISIRHHFNPTLFLKKSNEDNIELDESKTLNEAHVQDGDCVIIIGKPKDQSIRFSMSSN